MKKLFLICIGIFLLNAVHADPIPAAEAFKLEVKTISPNTFTLNWSIHPGYFLYSDRIHLITKEETNFHLGPLRLPPTQTKIDKQGHVYTIYRDKLSLPIDVLGENPGEAIIELDYQGCADDGFCYPPEKKKLKLSIAPDLALSSVSVEKNEPAKKIPVTKDDMSDLFTKHNWSMIFLIFYGLGLLLSFTPCILPMVPVLSGIIVGHGAEVTTRKAFLLSLSYVLSMSVTYAAIGAVVAMLGENLQINMQSPWAISLFSLVFIALAISMFGFYEFKLPHSWQRKIAGPGRSHRRGHYFGAAVMGALSTLILSPCVTAPLIGVLTYIAQTNNVLLGSVTLFFLSLGMGTPLLLLGISAGKLLPKTGSWMEAVKALFGVLLLGVALFLLGRILPPSITMFLWASLLIFCGVFAGALRSSNSPIERVMQSIGIIILSYGLLILAGTSIGGTDPIYPLSGLNAGKEQSEAIPMTKQNVASVEQQLKQAKGQAVMLDFYADWCSSCKVVEATTFKDPEVQKLLNKIKVIKVDVTQNSADDKELMHYFDVIAPPTFVFIDKEGEEIDALKIVGEPSTERFLGVLQRAVEG